MAFQALCIFIVLMVLCISIAKLHGDRKPNRYLDRAVMSVFWSSTVGLIWVFGFMVGSR